MITLLRRLWTFTLLFVLKRQPVNPVQKLIGVAAYQELLNEGRVAIATSKMKLPVGFGDDELVLVYLYTHQKLKTFHYKNINAVLRRADHPRKRQILKLAGMLTEALLMLPAHVGQTIRITHMDPATAAKHGVGQVVCYKAFTSTGDTNWIQAPDQVKLTIAGKNGRFIGGLSRFPEEREVLFRPGTKFRVLAASSISGSMHYVLEEL